MRYQPLGDGAVSVSQIGFDVASLFRRESGESRSTLPGDLERQQLLFAALDFGITFYRTSNDETDVLLSTAFRKQRDQLVISAALEPETPFEARLRPDRAPTSFQPASIRAGIEQTLRRLRTDRVDLLVLEPFTTRDADNDEVWETLVALRREGKILQFGGHLHQNDSDTDLPTRLVNDSEMLTLQVGYNLLETSPGKDLLAAVYQADKDSTPSSVRHGQSHKPPKQPTRIIAVDPHAGGDLLSLKTATPDLPAEQVAMLMRMNRFRFLTGKESGRTLAQAALAWLFGETAIASVICGARTEEMLAEFAAATEFAPMSLAELIEVEEVQRELAGQHK